MRRTLEIGLLALIAAHGWDMIVLAVRALSSRHGLGSLDEMAASRVLLELAE